MATSAFQVDKHTWWFVGDVSGKGPRRPPSPVSPHVACRRLQSAPGQLLEALHETLLREVAASSAPCAARLRPIEAGAVLSMRGGRHLRRLRHADGTVRDITDRCSAFQISVAFEQGDGSPGDTLCSTSRVTGTTGTELFGERA